MNEEKKASIGLTDIASLVTTTDREVEFKPAGKSTGWFFRLRHESAPEVQDVIKNYNAKVRDLLMRRKNTQTRELAAEHENRLRIAHVINWRWKNGDDPENGRPPFSKKELKDVLENEKLGYHVKQFIDDEVGVLEDFLEKSESSSLTA